MNALLVDTGPLVALINPRDSHREACSRFAGQLTAAPITTWPVLTEAAYLLRRNIADVRMLFRMVTDGDLLVASIGVDAVDWLDSFLARYADMGPQLADASLVYLAQSMGLDEVFTLDVRDFSIYRTDDGKPLRIYPRL